MGLIDKKKDRLHRVEVQQPTKTVDRNLFLSPSMSTKKTKKETTTIRCDVSIADQLNTLTVLLDFDSVNDLLDTMISKEISTLDTNKKQEFKTIEAVYKQKRNLKKRK